MEVSKINAEVINSFEDRIVGCGKVAGTHALAYQALPTSEFVAVCDVAPERAQQFAAKFHVKPYTDLAQMLRKEKSMCSPYVLSTPSTRRRSRSLRLPARNVISEKPLGVDLVSCDVPLPPPGRRESSSASSASVAGMSPASG